MFTRIVVGSDGSSESRDAVVLGSRIAAATGAGLTLLGTFRTALFPAPGYTDRRTSVRDVEQQLAADRDLYAPEAHIHAAADGSPARALRHYAEEWNADLVIVGSASDAPPGIAAISRTGRELMSHASFAVAVAEKGIHLRDFVLERVGVGYDSGPESEIALELASAIAGGADAQLEVMAVVDDGVPALNAGEWLTMTNWDQRLEFDREEALELAEAAVAQRRVSAHVRAVLGEPRAYLRRSSEEFDLMVIGSRRWGTLARVVLGGVGETLASGCGSSLIVTRRAAEGPTGDPRSRQDADAKHEPGGPVPQREPSR